MATVREESISYQKPVVFLEQFLLEKQRRIRNALTLENFSNACMAELFYFKVTEILQSHYFQEAYRSFTVGGLMNVLKQDDLSLKERETTLLRDLEKKEEEIESFCSSKRWNAFMIPDEEADYFSTKKQSLERARMTIQEELSECRNKLRVCRDLKGIICRPVGFFASIWR